MSTVEVKDRIKAILDEDCWRECEQLKKYNRGCPKRWLWDKSYTANPRPECWMCHKHDALAERIAEEVGK